MKRHLALTLILGFSLSMSACSSSGKKDEEAGLIDETANAEIAAAGTDEVPVEGTPSAEMIPQTDAPVAAADAPIDGAATAEDPFAQAPASEATPALAEAPAAVEPPVAEASPVSDGTTENYTVQEGDTLMQIAFETYGDLYRWKEIYEMNKDKIPNQSRLAKGTVLQLVRPSQPVEIARNGDKYLIKSGDTLGTISDDVYGTTRKWRRLWENNKQLIKNPNRIFAGFYLYYIMTPEDKSEAERLKLNRPSGVSPVAGVQPAAPAAAPVSVPTIQGTPRLPTTIQGMPALPVISNDRSPASAGSGAQNGG